MKLEMLYNLLMFYHHQQDNILSIINCDDLQQYKTDPKQFMTHICIFVFVRLILYCVVIVVLLQAITSTFMSGHAAS